MLKYSAKNEAPAGSFALPLASDEKEVLLTSLILPNVNSGNRIELEAVIVWEKPVNCDLGELEVVIRKDSPSGSVVYLDEESCYQRSRTVSNCTDTVTQSSQHIYFLMARSSNRKAIITGPIILKGYIYE